MIWQRVAFMGVVIGAYTAAVLACRPSGADAWAAAPVVQLLFFLGLLLGLERAPLLPEALHHRGWLLICTGCAAGLLVWPWAV